MDKDPIVTCPICLAHLDASQAPDHWAGHVHRISTDAPEHAGEFTWVCSCGPTTMRWADEGGAAAGLALHMQMRHNIAV
jgi:hypothetical protein